MQFKSCSFPSTCPEHPGGTEPKRDAQTKPCLSGNQQQLCHRAGRCWISWLCFWGLKTIAEVCSETRRSPSPLLPPPCPSKLLDPQPLELDTHRLPTAGAGYCGGGHAGTLHPSSPQPRLCCGSTGPRTMLVVPSPGLWQPSQTRLRFALRVGIQQLGGNRF